MSAWVALGGTSSARAQSGDPTLRDSFAIGSQGGAVCEVRATVRDSVIEGMFDRAWMVLCRDASQPVGSVRMLRATPQVARARIDRGREGAIVCTAPGACTLRGSGVAWTTRCVPDGGPSYTAPGIPA